MKHSLDFQIFVIFVLAVSYMITGAAYHSFFILYSFMGCSLLMISYIIHEVMVPKFKSMCGLFSGMNSHLPSYLFLITTIATWGMGYVRCQGQKELPCCDEGQPGIKCETLSQKTVVLKDQNYVDYSIKTSLFLIFLVHETGVCLSLRSDFR